jgi:hypothetical protein
VKQRLGEEMKAKAIADWLNILGAIWCLFMLVPTWFDPEYFDREVALSVALVFFAAQTVGVALCRLG